MDKQPFTVGDWKVEPELNRLSQGDENVGLQPKVVDLLVYLSSRPGEVVTVDDLIEDVWDGIIVTSQSVYNCVTQLRHAFGEGGDQADYIETIPKRGYRLVASVTALQEAQSAAAPLSSDTVPAAVERTAPVDEVHEDRAEMRTARTGRRFLWPALAAFAVVLIGGWSWLGLSPGEIEIRIPGVATPKMLPNSVAVLPFTNLSPDPNDAYFAAGIHEEILNQLAGIKGISVIARTSAMQYAETTKLAPIVAEELRVKTILEGSVRYSGERVRITVQLVDGKTGAHLWSEAYDRDLKDIFAIQLDIAQRITEAMKVEFDVAERKAIGARATENLEAYTLYVKARGFMKNMQSTAPMHEALEAALALDPDFAAALAFKAAIYALEVISRFDRNLFTAENQARNIELAQDYAKRALALDPNLADAYLALNIVDSHFRRWEDALANIERAFQLSPNDASIAIIYGMELGARGRVDEMFAVLDLAAVLDPLNWSIFYGIGGALGWAERWEEAQEVFRRVIALAPDRGVGYARMARASSYLGDRELTLKMARKAETLPLTTFDNLELMDAYHRLDRPDDVERAFERLQEDYGEDQLDPADLYQAHLILGDLDRAMDLLNDIIDSNFPSYASHFHRFKWRHPYLDAARDHPRFQEALRKLGVVQ